MKKRILTKVLILSIVGLVSTSLIFSGCNKNNEKVNKPATSNTQVDNNKDTSKNDSKDTSKNNSNSTDNKTAPAAGEDKNNKQTKISDKKEASLKLEKKEIAKDKKIEFNTEWKESKEKTFSACVEGKGKTAAEEGIGQIIVKNLKNNSLSAFELVNNKKQLSPKYVEWLNDKMLFVTIGQGYGTITKGGNLYLLDVESGKLYTVIENSDPKVEIMSLKKVNKDIELKVNAYEDDNFMKSHEEKWIIKDFDEMLSKKMEVKNDKDKVVYTIE